MILHDFHWPKEMYREQLEDAGFGHIECIAPTLHDIPPDELKESSRRAGSINGKWSWMIRPSLFTGQSKKHECKEERRVIRWI